jgi:hypothetical protein
MSEAGNSASAEKHEPVVQHPTNTAEERVINEGEVVTEFRVPPNTAFELIQHQIQDIPDPTQATPEQAPPPIKLTNFLSYLDSQD